MTDSQLIAVLNKKYEEAMEEMVKKPNPEFFKKSGYMKALGEVIELVSEYTYPTIIQNQYVVLMQESHWTLLVNMLPSPQRFIVAAGLDPMAECWSTGVYFSDLEEAIDWMHKAVDEEEEDDE